MTTRRVDLSLTDRVQTALRQSAFAAVRRLECEVEGNTVWLRGHVPTYYTRQVALELARHMKGVDRVFDAIEVQSPYKK